MGTTEKAIELTKSCSCGAKTFEELRAEQK